jgi:hypothetical protein
VRAHERSTGARSESTGEEHIIGAQEDPVRAHRRGAQEDPVRAHMEGAEERDTRSGAHAHPVRAQETSTQ